MIPGQTLGTSNKIIPTKRALPIRFKRRGGQSTFPPSKTRRACHVKWGWKMIQKPLSWPKKHISSHLPHHQLLPELPRHWQWRYATTYHRYIVSVERCHGGHQNDLPAGKKVETLQTWNLFLQFPCIEWPCLTLGSLQIFPKWYPRVDFKSDKEGFELKSLKLRKQRYSWQFFWWPFWDGENVTLSNVNRPPNRGHKGHDLNHLV